MTVRNLTEYIEYLTNRQRIPMIGSQHDPLLKELLGSKENLDAYIGPLTKFATNTSVQIFYEFLQNADDAGATNVFFYFDKESFVVINNGAPFYTDCPTNKAPNERLRKGQLKSFLSKGDKYGDEESIGRYGQGAKLLYDLLIPVHYDNQQVGMTKENALIKALIEEARGPILYSWTELTHFEKLLNWQGETPSRGALTTEDLPLLTKILFTYYPASFQEVANTVKGTHTEVFRKDELEKCVYFLNAIRLKFSMLDFQRGTLLYIPLGVGQQAKLLESLNDSLKSGITTSLAFLKNLSCVQLLNEELRKSAFTPIQLSPIQGVDQGFDVLLNLPDQPKAVDLYNFFQYFPVTETTYGLKMIIQTKAYEIGGDRQRIDLTNERNKKILAYISQSIQAYIRERAETKDLNGLMMLVRCIVSTDLGKLQKEALIKELFYDKLVEALKSFLPTANGSVRPFDSVKIKDTAISVQPEDLGLNGWEWLHEDLSNYYQEISDHLTIPRQSILDCLKHCNDRDKLSAWMVGLSNDEYSQVLEEIEKSITSARLKALPMIRFSDQKVHTLNELESDPALFFLTPSLASLAPILTRYDLVCGGIELYDFPEIENTVEQEVYYHSEEYLRRFSNAIAKLDLNRDEKWRVFSVFKSIPAARCILRSEMLLFENQAGQKRPLDCLLKNASDIAPSGLLRAYGLKASELYHQEMDEWLMKKEEVWRHLLEDWPEIAPYYEISSFEQAVKDMQNIFEASNDKICLDKPWIQSDDESWIASDNIFFNKELLSLDEEEYGKLCNIIQKLSDFKTIPFKHIDLLDKVTFTKVYSAGLEGLSERLLLHLPSILLSEQEIKLLLRISINNENFFNYFIIVHRQTNTGCYEIKQQSGNDRQYTSKDRLLNEFLLEQEEYFLLPEGLLLYFQQDDSLLKESESFIQKLISEHKAQPAFIDAVRRQGEVVKRNYLNCLGRIDLSSGETPLRYTGTFEGKVIDTIATNKWEDDHRDKIYIDGTPLNEYRYHDEVSVKLEKVTHEAQLIQFQLSVIKPEYRGKSDALTAVKDKLDGIRFGRLFNQVERYPLRQLEEELRQFILLPHPEQLSFLITFYHSESGMQYYQEESFARLDKSWLKPYEVLQAFYEKQITFFHNYPLPDTWFDLRKYLDTVEESLLLPQEKLPQQLEDWRSNGDTRKRTEFLKAAGLRDGRYAAFEFRRKVSNEEQLDEGIIEQLAEDKYFTNNTLTWIANRVLYPMERSSNRVSSIHCLISSYFEAHQRLPEFLLSLVGEEECLKSILHKIPASGYYVRHASMSQEPKEQEIWVDAISKLDHTFVDAADSIYAQGFIDALRDQGLAECFLEREVCVDQRDDVREWTDPNYRTWKEQAGKGYYIFLCAKQIPFDYYLISGNEKTRVGHYHLGKAERHSDDQKHQLFLYKEQEDNVLRLLADHQDVLFKNDADKLVKLMSMSLENEISPTIGGDTIPGHNNTPVNGYVLKGKIDEEEGKRLEENLDLVNEILERTNRELLEKIANHLDLIKDSLEEKEKKITPNSLVGLIGERLVFLMLKKTHPNSSSLKYVALERPEYDIELDDDATSYKIDVKTTIKSIREDGDTIPFFLKRSQYDYIRKNPNDQYYINRLSIQDLGLTSIYEKFKPHMGSDISEEFITKIDAVLKSKIEQENFKAKYQSHRMNVRMNIPEAEDDF